MGPAPPPPAHRAHAVRSAGGPPLRRWTATGKGSAARRLRSATSACEQPALAARPSERRPVRSGLVFALANLHDSARSPSPPPPPAHPALQSTSSPRSGRRPSSRRTRPSHRASCAPVAPIAVAPRRHRASWHRRRGPGPQRRRPATSPRNPPLRTSVPCAEWCRVSTSATPRLLASPAQKSASASRSIGFWRDFLARAAAGLLYARRRGQDEWDVRFADRINSALCSPHLALAAHPSSTPLTLDPHPRPLPFLTPHPASWV